MTFIVYSKPNCPQCDSAKDMLSLKGRKYEERLLDMGQAKDPAKVYYQLEQLKELVPTAKSVPQVFQVVDGKNEYVGGLKELRLALL